MDLIISRATPSDFHHSVQSPLGRSYFLIHLPLLSVLSKVTAWPFVEKKSIKIKLVFVLEAAFAVIFSTPGKKS